MSWDLSGIQRKIPCKTTPQIFISFWVLWSHKALNWSGRFFAGIVKNVLISAHKHRLRGGISVPLIMVWSGLTILHDTWALHRLQNILASRNITHECSITKIIHKSRSYWVSLISAKMFSVISWLLNCTNLSTASRHSRLEKSKKTPHHLAKQSKKEKIRLKEQAGVDTYEKLYRIPLELGACQRYNHRISADRTLSTQMVPCQAHPVLLPDKKIITMKLHLSS